MTEMREESSSALVRMNRGLIRKAPSLLAKRGLGDLSRIKSQPRSVSARMPLHVLYADQGLDKIFHRLVQRALGARYHILPVWSSCEPEIRLLWAEEHFDCAFLVLNNISVPQCEDSEVRIARSASLIPWMREHSSATIITACGWQPWTYAEKVICDGADRFFALPFPMKELVAFLRDRFGVECTPPVRQLDGRGPQESE